MINIYWVNSEDILEEKYAVWKTILRWEFLAPIIEKELIYEYQFCTFIDLFSKNDDNKSGHFDSIEDYNSILIESLEEYKDYPPENTYFGMYPQKLDKIEVDYFIKNWKEKQEGYLYPKIYDAETNKEFPAYYILLCNYYEKKEFDALRGLVIPETKAEMESILFENELNKLKMYYERDGILKFDYPYYFIHSNIQKIITSYFKNELLPLEKMNEYFEEINKIDDVGVRKYLNYIFKSFAEELENKKLFKSCKYCNTLFDYLETKKYCSESCKLKSKNKRYYSKNSNVIKKKKVLK